jgi:hypothetical protein
MRDAPIGKDTYAGWIVTGVFQRPSDALGAVDQLHAAHFTPSDVGLLLSSEDSPPAPGAGGASWLGSGRAFDLGAPGRVHLSGVLAEPAAPGVTGPDGLSAILLGLGVPSDHAAWYAEKACQGFAIVVVRAGTREMEARRIMHDIGSLETPSTQREPSTAAGYELSVKGDSTLPVGGDLVQPQPGWPVLGSDQRAIGHVDSVGPTYLIVQGGGLYAHDLSIPFSAVARVEPGKVYLDLPSGAVGERNWSAEPGVGEGANVLTSATYHPAGVPGPAAELPDAPSASPPREAKG